MTDPSPLGEAPRLRQLIAQWRERHALSKRCAQGAYQRCIDELETAVAEGAARRGPQPDWQPIDTAPFPGPILATTGRLCFVVRWNEVSRHWQQGSMNVYATHWMPLPAAPLVRSSAPPQPELDVNRCAVCGWSLDPLGQFCKRGNCSQRPLPDRFYDPVRARAEYAPHLDNDPRVGLPPRVPGRPRADEDSPA